MKTLIDIRSTLDTLAARQHAADALAEAVIDMLDSIDNHNGELTPAIHDHLPALRARLHDYAKARTPERLRAEREADRLADMHDYAKEAKP